MCDFVAACITDLLENSRRGHGRQPGRHCSACCTRRRLSKVRCTRRTDWLSAAVYASSWRCFSTAYADTSRRVTGATYRRLGFEPMNPHRSGALRARRADEDARVARTTVVTPLEDTMRLLNSSTTLVAVPAVFWINTHIPRAARSIKIRARSVRQPTHLLRRSARS